MTAAEMRRRQASPDAAVAVIAPSCCRAGHQRLEGHKDILRVVGQAGQDPLGTGAQSQELGQLGEQLRLRRSGGRAEIIEGDTKIKIAYHSDHRWRDGQIVDRGPKFRRHRAGDLGFPARFAAARIPSRSP